MGPTKNEKSNKKSWSEINKLKKEERKKWKEVNLSKKINDAIEASDRLSEDIPGLNHEISEVKSKSLPFISTISIAVPGSILENAQSPELRTYLAGQIARAACIFQIDEIVVFDDFGDEANSQKSALENETGIISARYSCIQFGRILQYLECPQYLRKNFFPIHADLKYCGLLNPINAPHHLGPKEEFNFREGVVLNKPVKNGKGSYVNVGLMKEVQVDKSLTPGIRCTVRISTYERSSKKLKGIIVSPRTPRAETGVYWGYNVRIATSISKVFSQCPFKDGYDLTIGTSDKGTSVDHFECSKYKHLLIMFGGLQGLEAAVENDHVLNVDDPKLLFDYYLNTLPNQGSKTIRTEEAVLVSLAALRAKLNPEGKAAEFAATSMEHGEGAMEVTGDEFSRFD